MIRLFLIFCLVLTSIYSSAQAPPKEIWYVGTFSEAGSKGLYVIEYDRLLGQFTELQTVHDRNSPSFLTLDPDGQFLYVAYRGGLEEGDPHGTVAAYRIDARTGLLTLINEVSSMGASPCHVSVDPTGEVVFVSNYQGGNFSSYKVREDGGLHPASSVVAHEGSNANPDRQSSAHMHSAVPAPDGRFVYASDLGADKIFTYKVEANTGTLVGSKKNFVRTVAGAGPRHFTLHPTLRVAYSVEELTNTVMVYEVNPRNGRLKSKRRHKLLSPNIESDYNAAADIHISVDGKWLYVSNRGQDNLARFQINPDNGNLTALGHVPTGGKHPRNFKVDQFGQSVYVANMESGNILVFSFDPINGALVQTDTKIEIPHPACIEQLFIEH